MNAIASRFSSSSSFKPQSSLGEDEEYGSEYGWGSQAGFGNLTKGLPTFTMPQVQDVSLAVLLVF